MSEKRETLDANASYALLLGKSAIYVKLNLTEKLDFSQCFICMLKEAKD